MMKEQNIKEKREKVNAEKTHAENKDERNRIKIIGKYCFRIFSISVGCSYNNSFLLNELEVTNPLASEPKSHLD
jgi:hypothetical protein